MGFLQSLGDVLATIIILQFAMMNLIASKCCGIAVGLVDYVCGSGQQRAAWHPQRYHVEPIFKPQTVEGTHIGELDELAMTTKSATQTSGFPFSPSDLIDKARIVLASEFGTKTEHYNTEDILSQDFQFVAPVIGPLNRSQFVKVFGDFDIYLALPDFKNNVTFMVDPMEPNRVWFFSRAKGTHTGPLQFGSRLRFKPTYKTVLNPPQASSLLFDEEGKVYTLTAGYVMDKRVGNTGGLGALFGILHAIGKPLPIPEGRAWTPSLGFSAFERFGSLMGEVTSISKH